MTWHQLIQRHFREKIRESLQNKEAVDRQVRQNQNEFKQRGSYFPSTLLFFQSIAQLWKRELSFSQDRFLSILITFTVPMECIWEVCNSNGQQLTNSRLNYSNFEGLSKKEYLTIIVWANNFYAYKSMVGFQRFAVPLATTYYILVDSL